MSTYDIFLKLLQESDKKQGFKEYLEEQPDMFDQNREDFYFGDQTIKVRPNKQGSKDYIFDSENSNKVEELLDDPADYTPIIQAFAISYTEDDDVAKLLDRANREDFLLFNTANNGPIRVAIDDIFNYINYLKREERFTKEESVHESEENEDWMIKWKESKNKFMPTDSIIGESVRKIQKDYISSI